MTVLLLLISISILKILLICLKTLTLLSSITKNNFKEADNILYNYLNFGKKLSKEEAGYLEIQNTEDNMTQNRQSCDKCKFNLPAEQICHIVEGYVHNERGISKYFSPKGYGMLPGDIVWDYVRKTGKKLDFKTAYVIDEASDGFNCKDC